jgi:pimeloyl-ACP methyl ester carboxylesterase
MISQVSGFKVLERNFKKTLCLLPGWATDYRIFSLLDLDYNYLVPLKFSPFEFKDKFSALLSKKSLGKISLLGWSLGGFLAAELTLDNPQRIDELILVSMRKNYPGWTLEEVRAQLKKNRKAYLYKFYLECFSDSDRESLSWFKKNLLRDYLSEIKLKSLIEGLDYLSQATLDVESLSQVKKIRFFHGLEDKIAPREEISQMQAYLPQAEFIYIKGLGHTPFLNRVFREKFYRG